MCTVLPIAGYHKGLYILVSSHKTMSTVATLVKNIIVKITNPICSDASRGVYALYVPRNNRLLPVHQCSLAQRFVVANHPSGREQICIAMLTMEYLYGYAQLLRPALGSLGEN